MSKAEMILTLTDERDLNRHIRFAKKAGASSELLEKLERMFKETQDESAAEEGTTEEYQDTEGRRTVRTAPLD